jgi:general stress protein YciG
MRLRRNSWHTYCFAGVSNRKSSKNMEGEQKTKSKRGFASMSPEKQLAIASKGGKSVPAEKRSFSQSSELASTAGKKGGKAVAPANRSFSRNPELASQAGTKGGIASHGGGQRKKP